MASININRSRYRRNKSEQTWLDKFITAQVKDAVEVVKKVGEREIKSTQHAIVPWKMFALIKANGFEFPGIQKQVEDGAAGAIGRARMIFSGALNRKILKGEKVFDINGVEVDSPELSAYRHALASPVVITPVAASAATPVENPAEHPAEHPVEDSVLTVEDARTGLLA